MVYREELMADAEELEKTMFSSSVRMLEAEYRKAERRKEVRHAFEELLAQWEGQIPEAAASLGICFLRSDILMRTGKIRLTLYGQDFYMDENRLERDWELPCFWERYEQDMAEIMDKLRKKHPRIYAYEEDAVRYQYAEYYYAALQALCRDMLEEIQESEVYRTLRKEEDFFTFFGRWRGEAEKLVCIRDI